MHVIYVRCVDFKKKKAKTRCLVCYRPVHYDKTCSKHSSEGYTCLKCTDRAERELDDPDNDADAAESDKTAVPSKEVAASKVPAPANKPPPANKVLPKNAPKKRRTER